ncbi:MAG: hypothetical protein QOE59_2874, partial [Actinomycetota bacterium]|nr:hypothetical protein [Actinomycetota bacterium]
DQDDLFGHLDARALARSRDRTLVSAR